MYLVHLPRTIWISCLLAPVALPGFVKGAFVLGVMVGKRVEVTGKIDAERSAAGQPTVAPTPDRGPGPDAISLPEFEAASIREISGMCAPTPAAAR